MKRVGLIMNSLIKVKIMLFLFSTCILTMDNQEFP
jgi:hypothetical protein